MPQFEKELPHHQIIEANTSPEGHWQHDQKLHKLGRDAQHYSGTEHAPETKYHYPAGVEKAVGEYLGSISAREDMLHSTMKNDSDIFHSIELDKKSTAEEDARANLRKQLPGATDNLINSVVDSRRTEGNKYGPNH